MPSRKTKWWSDPDFNPDFPLTCALALSGATPWRAAAAKITSFARSAIQIDCGLKATVVSFLFCPDLRLQHPETSAGRHGAGLERCQCRLALDLNFSSASLP
jgi:hypothetical protein